MNAEATEVATATKTAKKKVEVETVTMEDGTEQKFAGAREINRTFVIDTTAGTVTSVLGFRNGRILTLKVGPEDIIEDDGEIYPALLRFAAHGLTQKRGDETAGAKVIEDAVSWVENLDDMLKSGKWSEGRAPGSGEAGASQLARAVFIMREESGRPLTMEKVREYLRTKDNKFKLQLRGNPKISVIIKRLNEEAGKASPEDAAKIESEIDALD